MVITKTDTEAQSLEDICRALSPAIQLIYDNEASFLEAFGPRDDSVSSVSFQTTVCVVTFGMWGDERQVCIPIPELQYWLDRVTGSPCEVVRK